jgi:ABC-type multidrug transport system fused ATPase/permease subunit
MASVRADALRGVLGWPMQRLGQTPIGDLMARIIGDVEVFGRGIKELTTETWDTVLFSLSLIVAMMVYDARLTLLVLLPVPLGMLLARASGRWVSARTTAAREASADLTSFLQEHLVGLRVVRLFGRTEATVDRAAILSGRLADANLDIIRLQSSLQPVYRLIMVSGIVLVIWLGGWQVVAGAMTLGAFVAYLDLYTRFVGRGHRVPQLFNSVQSATAAHARLKPLLAPPVAQPTSLLSTLWPRHVPGVGEPVPRLPSRPPGPVEVLVQRVSFRFPGTDAEALQDLSLEIPPGAFVAVTGPVGSGKSALARVLLGLYPLDAGSVLLDGCSLDCLSQAERAARIGYLPQNPVLFSGTICQNLWLGRSGSMDATSDRAEQLLGLAALQDELHTFPKGLDTEIGERGVRLSGGQRQRIALARAFASNPGLLVLDDPFSSVDVDTEARIIAALRRSFGPAAPPAQQATIVFFSHRLAAFPQADLVAVLDQGRITQQGSHQALLAAPGLYARIYRAQQVVEAQFVTRAVSP